MKPDNYINVSASQVSPEKIKCGNIIEGESCQGQPCPQFEVVDYIFNQGGREYHTVQLRELPENERVKSEFVTGRLHA
jgi:hypothetical protein